MRIEFLPEARLEVEEALEWYLTRSVRAAGRFLLEFDNALGLIARNPGLWPSYEAGTHRYVLSKYPFSTVFRQTGKGIVIVAVAHHKRAPRYWVGR